MLAVEITMDGLRDAAGLIVAVAGAAAVLGRWVVRPIYKWGKRVEAALDTVEHEMTPNSGSSIKDVVTSTREIVDTLCGRVAGVEERLARGNERFDAIETRLAEVGPQQITVVNPPPPPQGE